MFKKLHITNFQSHKDTEIEFSENVTCITGLNNHGKSVLLRSLYKIVRDEPDGISFINDTPTKEDQCEITLETNKGIVKRIVKRNSSSAGNNMYVVNGVEFSNFSKSGIPLEVLQTLEVSPPIEFGDLSIDLNFHNQLDAMFLVQGVGLSSIRGKVVGKVTNIDSVQRAIQLAAAEEKQLKQDINKINKDLDQNKVDQEQYSNLPEQEEFLLTLEAQLVYEANLSQKIENIKNKREELKAVIAGAKTTQDSIRSMSQDFNSDAFRALELVKKIKLAKEFLSIDNSLQYYKKVASAQLPDADYVFLNHLNSNLNDMRRLEYSQREISFLQKRVSIDLSSIDSELLLQKQQAIQTLKNLFTSTQNIILLANSNQKSIVDYSEEETKVEEEFDLLKKELKICPTCQRAFV